MRHFVGEIDSDLFNVNPLGFILLYLTDNLLRPLLLIPWPFVESDFPHNVYFASVLLASQ